MQSNPEQTCIECIRPNCTGQTHLPNGAYLGCSHCGIELNDVIELVSDESRRNKFYCELCGHRYTDNISDDTHFMSHFNNDLPKSLLCIDCGWMQDDAVDSTPILEETQLSDASNESEQQRNGRFVRCDLCKTDEVFRSIRLWRRHNKKVHGTTEITKFPCHDCGRVFSTNNKWIYHRTKCAVAQKQIKTLFPCLVCEVDKFKTITERQRHEIDVHFNPKTLRYFCTMCEYTTISCNNLSRHMLTHSQKRTHVCEVCGKSFIRPHHLELHAFIHTDKKPFDCTLCKSKRSFKHNIGLQLHLRRIHSDQPRRYPCDQCDKVFKDSSDRRRHRWTHGGFEKKFKCTMCSMAFFENKFLRMHMKKHAKVMEGANEEEIDLKLQ